MDKGLFWSGMAFFIFEILAIIFASLVIQGISIENILFYGIGGFVILSMNIVSLILILKGLDNKR